MSTGAVVLSFLSGMSCDFFSFESTEGVPGWLAPPFDNTIAADMGLFQYRIRESQDPTEISAECIPFEGIFGDFQDGSKFWRAAQFCVVFAFVAGTLGCLVSFCECACPYSSCPFLLPSACFFCAFVLQCCTFFIFLENDYWYVASIPKDTMIHSILLLASPTAHNFCKLIVLTIRVPRNAVSKPEDGIQLLRSLHSGFLVSLFVACPD